MMKKPSGTSEVAPRARRHDVAVASNADEAEACFETGGEIGVLVTDLRMPGKDGLRLHGLVPPKAPAHSA